jgi:hypothetical protein
LRLDRASAADACVKIDAYLHFDFHVAVCDRRYWSS